MVRCAAVMAPGQFNGCLKYTVRCWFTGAFVAVKVGRDLLAGGQCEGAAEGFLGKRLVPGRPSRQIVDPRSRQSLPVSQMINTVPPVIHNGQEVIRGKVEAAVDLICSDAPFRSGAA